MTAGKAAKPSLSLPVAADKVVKPPLLPAGKVDKPSLSLPVAAGKADKPSLSLPVAVNKADKPSLSPPVAADKVDKLSLSLPVSANKAPKPSLSLPVAVDKADKPSLSLPVAADTVVKPSLSLPVMASPAHDSSDAKVIDTLRGATLMGHGPVVAIAKPAKTTSDNLTTPATTASVAFTEYRKRMHPTEIWTTTAEARSVTAVARSTTRSEPELVAQLAKDWSQKHDPVISKALRRVQQNMKPRKAMASTKAKIAMDPEDDQLHSNVTADAIGNWTGISSRSHRSSAATRTATAISPLRSAGMRGSRHISIHTETAEDAVLSENAVRNFHVVLFLLLLIVVAFRRRLRQAWQSIIYSAAKKDDANQHGRRKTSKPMVLADVSPVHPAATQRRVHLAARDKAAISPLSCGGTSPASDGGTFRGLPPTLDLGEPAIEVKPRGMPKSPGMLMARATKSIANVGAKLDLLGGTLGLGLTRDKRKKSLENREQAFSGTRGNVAKSFVPMCLNGRSVLFDNERAAICSALPVSLQARHWTLVFSSGVHGHNLGTMYHQCATHNDAGGPTLLIVADDGGAKLGVFFAERWKRSSKAYYGTGDMFVMSIDPIFRAYQWTGRNSYFACCADDQLMIGGGGDGYSIWLDEFFEVGTSARSDTFDNEPLASAPRFTPVTVEVWAFSVEGFAASKPTGVLGISRERKGSRIGRKSVS